MSSDLRRASLPVPIHRNAHDNSKGRTGVQQDAESISARPALLEAPQQDKLGSLIGQINDTVRTKWQKCSLAHQADTSKNDIRALFFFDRENLLSQLFHAAQAALPKDIVASKTWTRNDGDVIFSQHVVGLNESLSRAKIVATVLSLGESYLIQVWHRLLEHLEANDTTFADSALPFSREKAGTCFGTEALSDFLEAQHRFCPVNSTELNVDFEDVRYKLRRYIISDATTTCTNIDEHGKARKELTDKWSSKKQVQDLVKKRKDLVKSLYIGLRSLEESLPQQLSQLRKHYYSVLQSADDFYNGLASRERFLAILISSVSGQASAWKIFAGHCIDSRSPDPPISPALSDSILPLTMAHAEELLDDDDNAFYKAQAPFCPVKLKPRGAFQWQLEGSLVLPLLEKRYIDKGNFGSVYRVKIEAGYFEDDHDRELAMKVINAGTNFAYTEWRLAEKVSQEERTLGRLLVPEAMVRAGSEVFIFMPLAECNLESLMRGTKRRKRVSPQGILHDPVTKDDAEAEKYYQSLVPKTFEARLKMLKWMSDLAEALRELHHTLDFGTVYHGDVKTPNVLFTRTRDHPLQISDFGISIFKYARRSENTGGTADAQLSQLHLSSACPNFPPEAEVKRSVNGKADMWGFGIVLAEFIAWISGGPDALNSFKLTRNLHLAPHDDRFKPLSYYIPHQGAVKLKDGIDVWFCELIRKCPAEERQLYEDCWLLLKEGLLTCDPEKRLDADKACAGLRHVRRGETNDLRNLVTVANTLKHADSKDPLEGGKDSTWRRRIWRSPKHQSPKPRSSSNSTASTQRPSTEITGERDLSRGNTPQEPTAPTHSHFSFEAHRVPPSMTLMETLKKKDAQSAAYLINESTDVDEPDEHGNTLLHLAVMLDGVEATAKLVMYHSHLIPTWNGAGQTALHKCVRSLSRSRTRQAALILDKDPEAFDTQDRQGRTALQLAEEQNKRDMAKFLGDWKKPAS